MARELTGLALPRYKCDTSWAGRETPGRKGVLAFELSTLFYLFIVRNGKNGALDVHVAQITHVHSL
jgi:hypothetical protein